MLKKMAGSGVLRLRPKNRIGSILALAAVLTLTSSLRAAQGQSSNHDNTPSARSGGFAYVANFARDNTVSGFKIDPLTGGWTPVPGSPFPAGESTISVAADPQGRFVYATCANGVLAYRINQRTGALVSVSGSPFGAGSSPTVVTVDPSGRFVYATNFASNNVSAYKIHDGTGALTPVNGSPFSTGTAPYSLLVDATGKFLYITNAASGDVSAYEITFPTGSLKPVPNSPFATGSQPYTLAEASKGGFLYVFNVGAANIAGFKINALSGELAPIPGSPFAASGFSLAVDPQSRFLYTVDANADSVSGFLIDPGVGALTPISGSPFPAGAEPGFVTVDARGEFAYVADYGDSEVSVYSIDRASGVLMPGTGSPFASGPGPNWIALSQPGAVPEPAYSVKQIPPPPFGQPPGFSIAAGINSKGEVIGNASYSELNEFFEYGFLYSKGSSVSVGAFNGGHTSFAKGINDLAEVVGYSSVSVPIQMYLPEQAFLYRQGHLINLDGRPGGQSSATAINNEGQITGSISTGTVCVSGFCPPGVPPPLGDTHAFLYTDGTMHDLGTLGGHFSAGGGINNRGEITGASTTPDEVQHLFLYRHGKMQDLGTDGGNTIGEQINDKGEIIGYGGSTGFLYRQGAFYNFPKLLGGAYSLPLGINNHGDVVGYSDVPNTNSHAFLYSKGQLLDLNDLVPRTIPLLFLANGINDSGQIVASGADGQIYLLTPTR